MGYRLEEATALFSEKGIAVSKVITVHSATAAKDTVIAQRPAPEEWTGEALTLVVSAGGYDVTYFCPAFTGMLKDEAVALAAELGLAVKFDKGGDLPGDLFSVTGQRPPPGEEMKAGDTVYLTAGGGDG
jgi:beta-lactam-binding protein with PASTA domain